MDEARLVFAQHGKLARPQVVGDDESEAILKGWLTTGTTAWLLTLQVGWWPWCWRCAGRWVRI